jgi:hypothetical protein
MMKSVGILLSLCVISYNANAQVSTEQRQWVEQALSEINHNTDTANMLWQYSQHTVLPDLIRIEHFDASKPEVEQWTLVSENGETPDKKRVVEYYKDRKQQDEGKDEDSHEVAFSDLVNIETLTLTSENDTSLVYHFVPNIEELDNKALSGELSIDKSSKQLKKILITNIDELSPAFSVTITKFVLELGFDTVQGLAMPAHTSTTLNGTVAIFKSLDSIQTVTYSDYKILDKPKT